MLTSFLALYLFLCVVVPHSHAQLISATPGRTAPTGIPKTTVQGTVLNSVTGEPLRRALVSLSGMASRSAFTDDEGHFTFSDVVAGPVMLQARKPGFFSPQESGVSVDTSKSTDALEVKLMPSGVIYGQIMGAEEPLERVPIRLLQSRVVEGRRRWIEAGLKMSDEDGNFRIPDLKPGIYKIAAGPSRSRDLDSLESGYALTFYQHSPDRTSANTVQLLPGQQLELNFKMQPVPLFTISGMVLGGTAQRTNLQVLDTSDTPLMIPVQSDPASSNFEAVVPAGRYNLRAMSYEGRGQMSFSEAQSTVMTAKTSVSVSKDMSGIVLTLEPAMKVPVIVRKESMKPEGMQGADRSGGRISSAPLVIVRLLSLTDENGGAQAMPDGRGENSPLVISNLQPGTYEIDVMPQGPWYVASAMCGSKNLLRETLTVTAGARVDPIEIVMRDDVAKLQGSIRGASTYGQLIIVSDNDSKRRTRGNYGPDGQVYAPGLAPGAYTIYAFDHPDEIEFTNPEALRSYQNRATHVFLSPNQTATITADMIETEQ